MHCDEYLLKSNVVSFQPRGWKKSANGCTPVDPGDALDLLKVFNTLSPQGRRAVARLAEQLASK